VSRPQRVSQPEPQARRYEILADLLHTTPAAARDAVRRMTQSERAYWASLVDWVVDYEQAEQGD
jgi:hypothetical protein